MVERIAFICITLCCRGQLWYLAKWAKYRINETPISYYLSV